MRTTKEIADRMIDAITEYNEALIELYECKDLHLYIAPSETYPSTLGYRLGYTIAFCGEVSSSHGHYWAATDILKERGE